MEKENVLFRDLSADSYPFLVTYRDVDTGELLDTQYVAGPGVLAVPAFWPRRVEVTVRFGDGEVIRLHPDILDH